VEYNNTVHHLNEYVNFEIYLPGYAELKINEIQLEYRLLWQNKNKPEKKEYKVIH
jgi:hypothetical protein